MGDPDFLPAYVSVSSRGGARVRLAATGEFDIGNADLLTDALRRQLACGRREVTLDVSGVTFLDVVALQSLLEAARLARATGGTLQLVRPSRCVERLLQLAGVEAELIGAGLGSLYVVSAREGHP